MKLDCISNRINQSNNHFVAKNKQYYHVNLNFSCIYDATSKTSSWIMKYNGSEFQEVPECFYYCPGNPVENLTELVDFNWNGEHWSDSFPIFSCINGSTVFVLTGLID